MSTATAVAATGAESDFRPLTQWRSYGGAGVPSSNWEIADGLIRHTPGGGDLTSVETFGDFELTFDWKISPGGNSGVMYRVDESYGAPYQSGPEYQILDNAGHADGQLPTTSAASAFGLYAPTGAAPRPVGEWNSARIVARGTYVEHWLNGIRVLSYEIGSPDWTQRVAASKFAAWRGFGMLRTGHIDLQDHGSAVEFRNFMIRPL